MATAISVANYQTALGEFYDALNSGDLSGASTWAGKAVAQRLGLPDQVQVDGQPMTLPNASTLRKELNEALLDAQKRTGAYRYEIHSRLVP